MIRTWPRPIIIVTAPPATEPVLLRRLVDVLPTLEAPSRSRVELGTMRRSSVRPRGAGRPGWREDSESVKWWRRCAASGPAGERHGSSVEWALSCGESHLLEHVFE
jgi:hypothetical protein